ncbi:uncharacterized protein SPPG_02524 [Spizellomyces punctatus DAOM BR117]|uniref:Leucine-rich repeat-containing protein 56 n=1 Tax=Spizellomyces punctatus (strain DAOM BR117) TaxID=645134 RepID=A0A0L0HM81_SPIPD|nr:uncharacterized protein SPPG_02524 [Spizellomyces punctatus DAOM BR117]KND02020.1 hypothetical protein SPPG_02524 [Spizellomyces punctatus DAOM BR117]|eukprot:XP_016610059.1 hypothetical protein SPPG_02524 [Spizellomyces punctatus DAOM BR117]
MANLPSHGVINPQVFTPHDEVEELVNGFLSEEKLITLTGTSSLDSVQYLEMKVDVRKTSLGTLGKLLPTLKQLKLNNSYIPTIRDIGSGFDNLAVLWMARCDLTDIDGIGYMTSLQEVYLAHNEISDLSSLSMLDNLQILDLEGWMFPDRNAIEDLAQIDYLAVCTNLRQLTIGGNPIAGEGDATLSSEGRHPTRRKHPDWRRTVCSILPNLRILDDIPVAGPDKEPPGTNEQSTSDPAVHMIPVPPTGRPRSASARRPRTAGGRPFTPPGIPRPVEDTSSGLTHGTGQIMAGNPILFLRRRRSSAQPPASMLIKPEKDSSSILPMYENKIT